MRVHVSDVNVLHGRISRFRSSGPSWGWGPCTFGFILPPHSSDLKLLMRVHIDDFNSSKLTKFSILSLRGTSRVSDPSQLGLLLFLYFEPSDRCQAQIASLSNQSIYRFVPNRSELRYFDWWNIDSHFLPQHALDLSIIKDDRQRRSTLLLFQNKKHPSPTPYQKTCKRLNENILKQLKVRQCPENPKIGFMVHADAAHEDSRSLSGMLLLLFQ